MGDIPAMRNMVPLQECFDEAYLNEPTVHNPRGKVPFMRDGEFVLEDVGQIYALFGDAENTLAALDQAIRERSRDRSALSMKVLRVTTRNC